MAEEGVSIVLCDEKMSRVDDRLARIEDDGKNTREGVGRLIRLLVEGNGQPSYASRIQALESTTVALSECAGDLKEAEKERTKEAKARERERKASKFALWLAIGGWAVTLLGIVSGVLTKLFAG
jgi:hypothetical protein